MDICTDYAEACQANGPTGYMTDIDNGVTNGFDWYEVNGGRQDNMIYFYRGREMTLEISGRKLLNSNQLPAHWEANREALLQFIEVSTYGLRGNVTDCETGQAIEAEIFIEGHDIDNSSVFSDRQLGDYYRFLAAGTYEVRYTAPDYDTIYRTVVVNDKEAHIENIGLCKQVSNTHNEDIYSNLVVQVVEGKLYLAGLPLGQQIAVKVFSTSGHNLVHLPHYNESAELSHLTSGVYYISIETEGTSTTRPLLIP